MNCASCIHNEAEGCPITSMCRDSTEHPFMYYSAIDGATFNCPRCHKQVTSVYHTPLDPKGRCIHCYDKLVKAMNILVNHVCDGCFVDRDCYDCKEGKVIMRVRKLLDGKEIE